MTFIDDRPLHANRQKLELSGKSSRESMRAGYAKASMTTPAQISASAPRCIAPIGSANP